MLKLELEDFLFEIKDEILSYEELGKEKADIWAKNFKIWITKNKHKNIKKDKNKIYYLIEDESEIFEIVDEYYYAVTENREVKYWENLAEYM